MPIGKLSRTGDVFVLDLGEGENRIDAELLAAVGDAADEVERAAGPRALVTTGSGRFYSTGLDLERPEELPGVVAGMHELFARLLALPVPTVAALNGHAFAGGAMLALAHDRRVMREDRGFFCLPEVDGAIAFTPGLSDLVAARLPPQVAHEAMTTGRRYTAAEALERAIADEATPAEEVVERAVAFAAAQAGKDPATLGAIKATLHRRTIASLRDREANRVDAGRFSRAALAARR